MIRNNQDPCCDASRENIPWLVNGTLSGSTAAAVREHIEDCRQCQADLQLHEEMRIAALGSEVTPMMPTTTAADVIGAGRQGRTQRPPGRQFRSWMPAIAACIAIIGVAMIMSLYLDNSTDETNRLYLTATSAGPSGSIDYVMQLRFEAGFSSEQRDTVFAQLAGVVRWSVDDRGNYEVYVQLDAPSFKVLQEYEEQAAAIAGVQSAKFTALQLPMR